MLQKKHGLDRLTLKNAIIILEKIKQTLFAT